MKKHTEKLPIDDLFSSKLEKMSLEPSAGAWEVLQAKVGNSPVRRSIPVWYRYAAAAACVVFITAIAWVLWSTFATDGKRQQAVATTSRPYHTKQHVIASAIQESTTRAGISQQGRSIVLEEQRPSSVQSPKQLPKQQDKEAAVALTNSAETIISDKAEQNIASGNSEALAMNTGVSETPKTDKKDIPLLNSQSTSKHTEERTLVVSIATPANDHPMNARPETLASVFNDDKTDKGTKPTKAARLFRKLKQLKEGEEILVADVKQDSNDDESGLLGRLYGNVRHSIDSKKAEKR